MNSTKIVCTIGPACDDYKTIKHMLKSGMDVARLNFSHNTRQYHGKLIRLIRKASKETGKDVAIIQDLQGPQMKIGDLDNPVKIKKNQKSTTTLKI